MSAGRAGDNPLDELEGFEPWQPNTDLADEWFTNAGRLPCPLCGVLVEVCGYDANGDPWVHLTRDDA